jgi:hypothetical protein
MVSRNRHLLLYIFDSNAASSTNTEGRSLYRLGLLLLVSAVEKFQATQFIRVMSVHHFSRILVRRPVIRWSYCSSIEQDTSVGGSFEHVGKSRHVWAGRLIGRNSCLAPATCPRSTDEHRSSLPYKMGLQRGPHLWLKDPRLFSVSLVNDRDDEWSQFSQNL